MCPMSEWPSEDRLAPAERLVGRDIQEERGRPLSQRRLGSERTIDSYMAAAVRPRWMERLMEIERLTQAALRGLAERRAELVEECAGDRAAFARRWTAVARGWDFEAVNDLVRVHNEWFPVERDLRMDPRTGEYLPIMGRPYAKRELDAAWVLERFPATGA